MAATKWPNHDYGLRGDALTVAQLGLERFGADFEITSGKRSREDQAAAMAANEYRAPGWIEETYADSAVRSACCDCAKWAREHSEMSAFELRIALLGVLRLFSDHELRALTRHLSGDAFDVRPLAITIRKVLTLTPRGREIANFLGEQATARGGKFLDREGGLLRLHWQSK